MSCPSPFYTPGRIAMLCVHTSPLAHLGGKDAGGMNVYVRELSRHLDKQGYKVDVFTRRRSADAPAVTPISSNARLIQVAAGPPEDYPKEAIFDHLPEFVCNVRHFAEEQELDYDLVHSHYWLSGWAGWLLKKWWNVPMIHMFHTLGRVKNSVAETETEKETERRVDAEGHLFQVADRIVAGSPMDKAQMILLYGAPAGKIEVIPCGVDLHLFKPLDRRVARRTIGEDEGKLILYVGRIEPLKGIATLIEAIGQMALCREGHNDLRLLIVGGDDGNGNGASPSSAEVERIRELAARCGVAGRVKFAGSQRQDHLAYYYAAADVTVVPSHYESFGMVALESMACATPVVASRVGGLASTIEDGRTGFLVPRGDPSALASKLELLLTEEELRERLGRQAASSVQSYSWPRIAGRLASLYQEAIRADSLVLRECRL